MPDDDKRKIGDINVTLGNDNRVGNIGHTVHVDRRIKRVLDQNLKDTILRELPNDRPVEVFGMNGNSESMAFAKQIHAFLKKSGYQMKQTDATWHSFFNPPVFAVKFSHGNNATEWWITVGPAE